MIVTAERYIETEKGTQNTKKLRLHCLPLNRKKKTQQAEFHIFAAYKLDTFSIQPGKKVKHWYE